MTKKIPLDKIKEGIQYSLKKSEEHLAGAELLIERNLLDDAVVLIEFAIEEFGRAKVLRDSLRAGSEDVEGRLFSNHDYKYKEAWDVLPNTLKTIYDGSFDPTAFSSEDFDTGETISPRTRLDAAFVNYDEENRLWKVGIRADKEKLINVVKGIREHIKNFKL